MLKACVKSLRMILKRVQIGEPLIRPEESLPRGAHAISGQRVAHGVQVSQAGGPESKRV